MSGLFKVGDKRAISGTESEKRLKWSPEDPKIVLKYRNFLKFQNDRELGSIAGVQEKKVFYQMKMSYKEEESSSHLSIPFSSDSCEVKFIKGDDKSLFGVWCVSNGRKKNNFVMGEISYNMNNEDHVSQNYKPCENIIDMCRGSTDFITVCNYPPEQSPSFLKILDFYVLVQEDYFPWYCCWFANRVNATILGGDGFVLCIGECRFCVKVPGKVCTLSCSPSEILTGLHTGELHILDSRTNMKPYTIKISDEAVNDSLFLNDQEVIITDAAGKLVKVDLRVRKISTTFFGHKHSVTKRPFSVASDMLCATGIDNVVRIWHLSGGHPIYVQRSTSGHEVRGWLNSDGNKTYLNYFERDTRTRTVFTI